MSSTPEQRLSWRAELQGAEGVKAKMEALLNLQREGSSASEKTRFQAKLATQEIGMQNRAMSALTRSWQIAHPQLALLTRGFSAFAAVGRTVFNILQGINIMQIRQRQDTKDLHKAQQDVNDAHAITLKNLAQFGKDSPQYLESLQAENKLLDDLVGIQDRIDSDKWQDLATQLTSIAYAFGAIQPAINAVNTLKALILAVSAAHSFGILSALGTAVGAMAKAAPMVGPIITAILLLIERLSSGKPITLESIFGEGSFWAPFIKDAQGFIKFWEDLPKHIQIWTIRARRSIEKWWDDVVNVFTGGTKKALDSVNKWGADIVKYFQDLYKKIVGGSIWPEMLDEMNKVADTKLGSIETRFADFGGNVTKSFTDSLNNLHGAMPDIGGQAQGYNVGARKGMAGIFTPNPNISMTDLMPSDPRWKAWIQYRMAASPGNVGQLSSLMNPADQNTRLRVNTSELNQAVQRAGLTINVYGSLIAEKDLINKVSEAIAGNTQALIR